MPQGDNGIYVSGSHGGVEAEDDANGGTDDQWQHDAFRCNKGRHPGKIGDQPGDKDSDTNANQSANGGKHNRLDQELTDDLFAFSADCTADTNLARTLGYRGQHDIHDSYAADE